MRIAPAVTTQNIALGRAIAVAVGTLAAIGEHDHTETGALCRGRLEAIRKLDTESPSTTSEVQKRIRMLAVAVAGLNVLARHEQTIVGAFATKDVQTVWVLLREYRPRNTVVTETLEDRVQALL